MTKEDLSVNRDDYRLVDDAEGGTRPRGSSIGRISEAVVSGASVFGSVCNLSNAILGAGMLALPIGFASSGVVLGLLLLMCSGAMALFTLHLLSSCSRIISPTGKATFFSIAERVMPPGTTWLVEAAVIANSFGLCCAYLVTISTLMPDVFPDANGAVRNRHLWVTVGLGFVTPLSFAKTLDALKFTSALGMACVFYMGFMVVYLFVDEDINLCPDDVTDDNHCGGEITDAKLSLSILKTLAIITFAFTCHVQLLPVANEVAEYSQPKMDMICGMSVLLCMMLYACIGYMGYMSYGDDVEGDVLLSYPNIGVVIAGRVGITTLVGVSYPLMAKPTRDSIISLMAESDNPTVKSYANRQSTYIGITVAILLLSYGIAMLTDQLDVIIGMIGATCSTAIMLIVPTLTYCSLHPEPHLKRYVAIFVGCLGCVMMPICAASTIIYS